MEKSDAHLHCHVRRLFFVGSRSFISNGLGLGRPQNDHDVCLLCQRNDIPVSQLKGQTHYFAYFQFLKKGAAFLWVNILPAGFVTLLQKALPWE